MTRAAAIATLALLLSTTPASAHHRPWHSGGPPSPSPTPAPSGQLYGASVLFGLADPIRDTDAAVAAGLDTIRIVNMLDERCGDPYAGWDRVDALVAAAKSRNLRVLLDLSSYRNLLEGCGLNPYTADWTPFLRFVAARYPTVDLVALAGEPLAPNSSEAGRPTSDELSAFYERTATTWRSLSAVPVESGGLLQLAWDSGIDWRAIFGSLRYCSVHIYSQPDIDYLPTVAAWCVGYPLLIEEFGMHQSAGDATRAAYFRSIYDLARRDNAGVGFWNLGPVMGDSYDVNVNTPLTWQAVREWAP
jgi:hypothetical protein